jgi:hypothetical protein
MQEGNMCSGIPHSKADFGLMGARDGQELDRASANTEKRWGCLLLMCIPRVIEVT